MTLVCGVAVIFGAIWISRRGTDIVETIATLAAYFIGPITGIFLMGALTRRANVVGVLVGAIAGLAVAVLYHFWPTFTDNVTWVWVAPITCFTTFGVGYVASIATPGVGSAGRYGDAHGIGSCAQAANGMESE